jgi:hypothetical protein
VVEVVKMPTFTGAFALSFSCPPKTHSGIESDTIKILVATDSHVGYEERDPIRKDDSWRSFDEVMQLAKTEDVCPLILMRNLAPLIYSRLIWFFSPETYSTTISPHESQCTKSCDLYE